MVTTVAEALMLEITRVRDEVMPAYLECGQGGRPALLLMRHDMDRAVKALAEQDATECIRLLRALEAYRT
jgi:hypothetical protein